MTRRTYPVFLVACLAVLLAACGSDTTRGPNQGDKRFAKVLSRVGPGAISARPGEDLELQALLTVGDTGPVSGAEVVWSILESPDKNARLDGENDFTNANGLARTQVHLGGPGLVVVQGEAEGAVASAVWKIEVATPDRRVRALESAEVVRTDETGLSARVSATEGRPVALRVQVTALANGKEQPVGDESVEFTFVSNNDNGQGKSARFLLGSGSVTTLGNGEASVLLDPGPASVAPFRIKAAHPQGTIVTFDVFVRAPGAWGSGSCVTGERPCPFGFLCDANTQMCVSGTESGCEQCKTGPSCRSVADCSGEMVCDQGTCRMPGVHCDSVQNMCVVDVGCAAQDECPLGFVCQRGVCSPYENPYATIDVTGHWFTQNVFVIRDALPEWVTVAGQGTRMLDQLLHAQLQIPGVPSWVLAPLNAIISPIFEQYIPPWVYKLVSILDNMLTMFSTLRAEGEMDLVSNGPQVVAGTESWNSFVFYALAQCLPAIPAEPTPACARFDIYANTLPGDIALNLRPFSAKVSSTYNNELVIDTPRQARLKLSRLLKWVLDQTAKSTLGFPSIEDKACPSNCAVGSKDADGNPCPDPAKNECGVGSGAISNLVPCQNIGKDAADWINQSFGLSVDASVTEAACKVSISIAGSAVAQQLGNVQVSFDALEFTGRARARTTGTRTGYADELGYADYETRVMPDGEWTGFFHVGMVGANVPGRWYASRNYTPMQ